MAKDKVTEKTGRTVNVTLKNEEDDKGAVIVSFSTIFGQLRRFLALWLVLAVIVGILIPVYSAVFSADQHKNLTALVSFNYDGIEKGLAPDGTQFDVNTIKNPAVIEAALTELGMPLTPLEGVRQGFSFEGVIPSDAIKRITMYKNIYEDKNLAAGEKMLDVSYFPTQYKVTFNYSQSGLTGEESLAVFNMILDKYREYFFENYGFNQALGSAVKALDYNSYDYAEAVDVFSNSLTSLQSYVSALSAEDKTRFRSTATGYTFADLSDSISTLKNVDLDMISSYVTVNNVTKDKNTLIDYYNYRVETLMRERSVAMDNLTAVNDAIANYQQSVTIIYGEGQDPKEYTQASTEYDNLFKRKIDAQHTVSSKTQSINMYQQRINALKSKNSASQDKVKKVEEDLEKLNTKINALLDATNITANEYYESVYLGNAYSVLVPPSSSALRTTKNVIDSSLEPIVIAEALLVVLYLGLSVVLALVLDNRKKPELAEGELDEDDEPEAEAEAEAEEA